MAPKYNFLVYENAKSGDGCKIIVTVIINPIFDTLCAYYLSSIHTLGCLVNK